MPANPKGGGPYVIVTVPFKQIGVEIVGPLTPTAGQHKYILVIDYAIQYPAAISLHTVCTDTIAKELASLFTQMGMSKQIVTNQESAFMSETCRPCGG